jgi:YbbR domain-containing protein
MAWHPFRNLGLKVFAVILATLMWLTVTRDQLVERSINVPLEFQNIPSDLELIGQPPATADVRVRGPSSVLSRLAPGEVVAVLDLRDARAGQRLFHLVSDEVRVPFGIQVAQINPATIALAFERSGSRIVPVVPAITGEPAPGCVAGRVTVDPASIEVVGPISRLEALKQATTEPVSIANASRLVRDRVTIGVADSALRLRIPSSATVFVEITPAPIERAVANVPVGIRNVVPGRRGSVEPARVTVVIAGAREALGSLDESQLQAWVDAAKLEPGGYSVPVRIEAGANYRIVRTQPASVRLRVR